MNVRETATKRGFGSLLVLILFVIGIGIVMGLATGTVVAQDVENSPDLGYDYAENIDDRGETAVRTQDATVSAQDDDVDWQYEAEGFVESGPTIVQGVAYFGDGDGYVHAVDIETTETVWSVNVSTDSIRTSAQVVGGTVYIGSTDGHVYALDADDGAELWDFETGDEVWASPTKSEETGLVYFGSLDGYLYAADAQSGEEEWSRSLEDRVQYSSPLVHNGTVYIGDRETVSFLAYGNMYAFDAETGEKEWDFEMDLWVNSSPTIANGLLYFGSDDGSVYALSPDNGGVDVEWEFDEPDAHVISAATYHDGVIYIGTDDTTSGSSDSPTEAVLYAIDADTGDKIWEFVVDVPDDPDDEDWQFHSSPTVVGDTVYVGNVNGNVYGVDTETGDETWRFETGDSVWSSPLVHAGNLYIGSDDGNLYALDVDEEGSSEDTRIEQGTLNHDDRWGGVDDGVEEDPLVYFGSEDGTLWTVEADTGDKRWEFNEPPENVRSSPTVVDGTAYVGSGGDLDNNREDSALWAVDHRGVEEWRFEKPTSNVRSSPTVVGDTAYVADIDGVLWAVNRHTGEEEWRFEKPGNRIIPSPNVVDGTAYFGSDSGFTNESALWAVDTDTGEEEWRFTEPGSNIESSATVYDGNVYFGSHDDTLWAVDTDTGEEEWRFTEPEASVISSPTVVEGTVYVGSHDDTLWAVDADTGEEEWRFTEPDWAVESSPTVSDGTVYVGINMLGDGEVWAVDAETGESEWRFEGMEDSVDSAPTVWDDTVYVGSRDGSMYALNTDTGDEEWEFDNPPDSVSSSPTVVAEPETGGSVDSRVRLRTLGHHDDWDNEATDRDSPNFEVEILETNSPIEAGESLSVDAEITNTGEVQDTQTVTANLNITGGDSESVSLDAGASVVETFEIETRDGMADGVYEVTVSSDDDSDTVLVSLGVDDGEEEFAPSPVDGVSDELWQAVTGGDGLGLQEIGGAIQDYRADPNNATVEGEPIGLAELGSLIQHYQSQVVG